MKLDDPPAVFLDDYADAHHAVMDWRLGYSVVRRLAGPLQGRAVLDYGCGDGKFSRVLAADGASVIGVDVNGDAIDAARARDGNAIEYRRIDSGDLSFIDDGAMDLAVSTFVLCCVRGHDELARIAGEVGRCLMPGGAWIIAEPNPDASGHRFVSMRREVRGRRERGAPVDVYVNGRVAYHDFYHTHAEYREVLAAAGLVIEQSLEPTADAAGESDNFWRDETFQAPFLILAARK